MIVCGMGVWDQDGRTSARCYFSYSCSACPAYYNICLSIHVNDIIYIGCNLSVYPCLLVRCIDPCIVLLSCLVQNSDPSNATTTLSTILERNLFVVPG